MNAITETGTAGLLARYDALRGTLPGDPALRAAAAQAFRSLGLPGANRGRRSEAWKYTSLAPVADMSFGIDQMSSPSIVTVPSFGRRIPESMLSSVVLPLPEGPTI